MSNSNETPNLTPDSTPVTASPEASKRNIERNTILSLVLGGAAGWIVARFVEADLASHGVTSIGAKSLEQGIINLFRGQ